MNTYLELLEAWEELEALRWLIEEIYAYTNERRFELHAETVALSIEGCRRRPKT